VLGVVTLDPLTDAGLVERMLEVAVIISLFAAGLNLHTAWSDPRRWLAIRLAPPAGSRWPSTSCGWSSVSLGLVGSLCLLLGRYVLHLRRQHQQAVGLGYFLPPSLIALVYGTTLLVHGYGFLGVFAAGVALRRMEAVVTVSILAHGASVKPLMERYANHLATRETGR
jgi:NhaP-type Na+/H+ or K+/H+ antiporter